jgi:hypothetical protein
VGLLEGAEERLESGKVTHELEDPEDPGHANETKDLPGFPNDVELGEMIDQEGDKVGQDGKQVDLLFRSTKFRLVFITKRSYNQAKKETLFSIRLFLQKNTPPMLH